MEVNKSKIEFLIRLFIILITSIGAILNQDYVNVGQYLIVLLLFILNSQIRFNFLSNKLLILSLFIDLGMIYYLYTNFSGVTHLLFFVTMLDSLIFLSVEGYVVSVIILGMMVYLIRLKSSETIVFSIAIYAIVFVFAIYIKNLRKNVKKVEELYDENRKYSYQLEDTQKRLEDYMKKLEHVSQLEERNRISREIHDTLGHKLTGVIMQLDAAIRVSEVDADKGRQIILSVRENMNTCIEILRQTVSSIRPKDYTSRMLSMQQMIEDFKKDSGIEICFNIKGIPIKLYPSTEITLYKNAQEAITNAVRHGKAKKIEVELEYLKNEVKLIVKDNGKGCKEVIKGMGVSGMEERAVLLGGKLAIVAEDGFQVMTILPIKDGSV